MHLPFSVTLFPGTGRNIKQADGVKYEKIAGDRLFFITLRRFTSRIVDKLREYKIAYKGLGEGIHTFTFELDNAFFDSFDVTKGTAGKVEATVVIVKSSLLMEVKMKISGMVKATCDRCLTEMDLPVDGELDLYAKYGERETGNDDDFIVLSQEDDFLDLSFYLYEIYVLNYPIKVVHPDGECDEGMKEVLDDYIVDPEKRTDPRWDDLKKLINN